MRLAGIAKEVAKMPAARAMLVNEVLIFAVVVVVLFEEVEDS